ncbi:hypothetical protein IV417_02285 [Alphaproteobacteria bacterium KMM 3653]|uniref:Uncharacterized protein n=1 Tax=Harenicola maris TaxID=2841044 RepID=A0AAP2G6V1_9RHOB|nr:hypothetical protein [Harenicola maris]
MGQATPASLLRDMKSTVMEALLALSQREAEAREEGLVLLADQIYAMREKVTDAAAVLAEGAPRDATRLPGTLSTAEGALARMTRADNTLPAAGALLLALDDLQPPAPDPAPQDDAAEDASASDPASDEAP